MYDLVFQVIMNGVEFSYNPRNPIIQAGETYGVLRKEDNKVCVHNRLYEQLIYDYMSSKLETSGAMGSAVIETKGKKIFAAWV